jgi:hypothetical protein
MAILDFKFEIFGVKPPDMRHFPRRSRVADRCDQDDTRRPRRRDKLATATAMRGE